MDSASTATAELIKARRDAPLFNAEAESAILGALYCDSGPAFPRLRKLGLTSDKFFDPSNKILFDVLMEMAERGELIDSVTVSERLRIRGVLDSCGGPGKLAELVVAHVSSLSVAEYAKIVLRYAACRDARAQGEALIRRSYEDPESFDDFEVGHRFETILEARKFDLAKPPSASRAIYSIGENVIATPGNLSVIAAQAKVGKSALVGAFISSTLNTDADTLGIKSLNTVHGAVIHFDTEQSTVDHHALVATALRRARINAPPIWLRSYCLVDVPLNDRFAVLEYELERAKTDHGRIHSVIIDGVADFVSDPNDAAEAFGAVERLHRLAALYDMHIICVLHFNPGSEFNKTRGHLGSQLERKAETNLALEKVNGITVCYTKSARHAFIEKESGPRFHWDHETKMHLSCESLDREKKKAEMDQYSEMTEELFLQKSAFRYSELVDAVSGLKHVKERQAQKIVKKLIGDGFVKKNFLHQYEKSNETDQFKN